MRIWEKILCSWACAAYCQNCEPNSHALRAQTVVLRSDAMRAHSRIFKQMLILSCVPAAFYVIGNKKCRSKPINSFHAGGGIVLKYGIFMWHIQYSRKGSSMYNKHSLGNFCPFCEHSWQVGGTVWANAVSEFAGDLTNRQRSKMDKITVNAFIHGRALSDPIELNPN